MRRRILRGIVIFLASFPGIARSEAGKGDDAGDWLGQSVLFKEENTPLRAGNAIVVDADKTIVSLTVEKVQGEWL